VSLQKKVFVIIFCITAVAVGSALHYKNRVEQITAAQQKRNSDLLIRVQTIAQLSREIRIATYPTACDAVTKEIIGEACDLGSYMEWAGPELEQESYRLLDVVKASQKGD